MNAHHIARQRITRQRRMRHIAASDAMLVIMVSVSLIAGIAVAAGVAWLVT